MKHAITLVSAIAIASTASAQALVSDDFNYTGALTAGPAGWVVHSGGTAKEINSNGSFAILDFSSGSGQDVTLAFPGGPLATTDDVYGSFILNVPSGNPVNPDGFGSYCTHFRATNGGFYCRFGLLSPAAGGDFTVAVSTSSSNLGGGGVWASDLQFDTNYRIVISYDANTGTSSLWVDPVDANSTSVQASGSSGQAIASIALRQSNDHTGFIHIDDIVAGNNFVDVLPAPAGAASTSSFGSGCGALGASFYEQMDPVSMDLAGTTVVGTSAGGSYAVSTTSTTLAPLGAGAVALGLGDDDEIDTSTVGGTLGLWVGSNGWIATGGGNSTSFTPSVNTMLNNPNTGVYAWTDLQPASGGGTNGDVWYEESGTVATVTFLGVDGWNTGAPNTIQFTYDTANGDWTIAFDQLSTVNPEDWLIGYSVGGPSVDAGPTDISAGPFSTAAADLGNLLLTSNLPVLGTSWDMTCDNMESTALGAFFFFGSSEVNPGIDLGVIGAPGCSAYTSNDLGIANLVLGASSVTLSVNVPNNPALSGAMLTVQSASSSSTNAFGASTSNGLTGTVGL
ncbi:MAG: hypothetical protein VX044_07150 [Planctomycetota bacterium]|nr:hypothetical protein [Planctomycetota bacterium]